ncbi:FtsB family cell division protein [Anaerococcus cruorum]|uniref:Septum formation initiator family protein n=1 Tax=Anaerococcus cruorum TaxID=3115617 RepID=A0ABW9MW07_9FIRM
MAKAKSYQRRRKAKNRRFLLTIFLVLLISVISYIFLNKMMKAEINSLDTEISSTQKKLDDVNKEITSLEKDYEIRNTDQFKEKIAQERLGMTKGNTESKQEDKSLEEVNEKNNKEDKSTEEDEDKNNQEDTINKEKQSEEPLEPETSNDDNQ